MRGREEAVDYCRGPAHLGADHPVMNGGARLERIDQLRGVAALAVVVCHAAVSAYTGVPNLGGEPWPWLGLSTPE